MSTINAPHILLLPSTLPSTDLRVITLPHPRTLMPTRYMVHPTLGLHEITKLATPASTPRSWLLTPPFEPAGPPKWLGNGQIVQDGNMYICTPVDPLFLLLPRLFPPEAADGITKFLPIEDLFEEITKEEEGDWEVVIRSQVTEKRLAAVCESVDVGDWKAYKPSREKLMKVLDGKCVRMAKGGLPATMEEGFVQKPLTRPVAEIMAEDAAQYIVAGNLKKLEIRGIKKEDTSGEGDGDARENAAEGARALSTPPDLQVARVRLAEASQEVMDLLRIRVASEFVSNSYLSISIAEVLSDRMQKSHDFTPLDNFLSELAKSRREATALRSDDFTLKRSCPDEGDFNDRKRKKKDAEEAEKNKKKSVSRATKELQKASTQGMAKMTTYFERKTT